MGEVHFVIKEVPKSWIDEGTQIQYFRHGLQQQHRLLLDATTNASLVDKSYDGVVSIIEAMTLSDQQSHNGQVSRLCRVTPTLAITRIINASLNLGKYNIQETNKGLMNGNREFNNQNYNQPWRHDVGSSNRQSRFQPPYQVKNSKLEDTLNQFMQLSLIDQKSIDPSMKNLEIKVGQISKQINDQNRGAFSAHTEPNPKENCQAITTIGGKVLGYDVGGEEETRMDELENTNKLSISLGDHDPSGSKEKGKARVDEGTCQLNEKPTMLIPYHVEPLKIRCALDDLVLAENSAWLSESGLVLSNLALSEALVSKSITQLIQSASKVETPIPNPLKPSRNHISASSLYPISKVPPSIT
ncbi:hypothetical protein Lal_00037352 [Lupinus albus]|nr:hypothetical protein Lal_00037352 [Lupinus albus]